MRSDFYTCCSRKLTLRHKWVRKHANPISRHSSAKVCQITCAYQQYAKADWQLRLVLWTNRLWSPWRRRVSFPSCEEANVNGWEAGTRWHTTAFVCSRTDLDWPFKQILHLSGVTALKLRRYAPGPTLFLILCKIYTETLHGVAQLVEFAYQINILKSPLGRLVAAISWTAWDAQPPSILLQRFIKAT